MKRTIAIAALCAGIMLTTFPSQAKESGNVKINAKNFLDTIVREYVSEKIDKNNDGYLNKKEISAVKTIIIDKNNLYWENKEKPKEDYEIIDCKGLEIFTNVEKVKLTTYCDTYVSEYGNIKNIKVLTKLTKIKSLEIRGVNNSNYDFTKLNNLERLCIKSTKLKKLNLSKNVKLKNLKLAYNPLLKKINLTKNNNLFEQMQALYKAWFIDFKPFNGIRPENWKDTNIYAIANIIYGAPFASKLFNTDGLGKPIIRIRDLKEQLFVTFTTEEHPKGHLIHPGDIVVGMDGEFRPYLWGNEPAWLNQRVCIFENNRPQGKAFVIYTIKPLLNKIEQTQVATTVIHIGKKDFDSFRIILPDETTLNNFDSITAPMIDKIVNNCLENKKLTVLRDKLLPKLISGEIDISNINL